jgi:two-component system response regulator NreC
MTAKRVVLLDDHQVFLDCFRIALGADPRFAVLGATKDPRRAYALVEQEKPDLLVSELLLHDTDGVSVARELVRRGVSTPVLILTVHGSLAFVREAIQAGVSGYALKEQSLPDVREAVHAVAEGQRYFAPALGDLSAMEPSPADGNSGGLLASLSRREQEVFLRILHGADNREIARSLSISVKTVETHRAHINRKLDVHSPAQLMRVAALGGLLVSRSGTALLDDRERSAEVLTAVLGVTPHNDGAGTDQWQHGA